MRILVDTHCWLWQLGNPDRLNQKAVDILIDPKNEIFLSAASIWEIAIKTSLGKLYLGEPVSIYIPRRMIDLGNKCLPIEQKHVLYLEKLPLYHRDPFDRIIVAQAITEELTLITADNLLTKYDVPLLWGA
jgi:PIN domain nuclease of toxin-antitoxin system